MILTTK